MARPVLLFMLLLTPTCLQKQWTAILSQVWKHRRCYVNGIVRRIATNNKKLFKFRMIGVKMALVTFLRLQIKTESIKAAGVYPYDPLQSVEAAAKRARVAEKRKRKRDIQEKSTFFL